MKIEFKRNELENGFYHQAVFINGEYVCNIFENDGYAIELSQNIEKIIKKIDSNIEVIKITDISDEENYYIDEERLEEISNNWGYKFKDLNDFKERILEMLRERKDNLAIKIKEDEYAYMSFDNICYDYYKNYDGFDDIVEMTIVQIVNRINK